MPLHSLQSIRIEPFFQCFHGAVVLKWAAVPHAFQRGHLVVTSSLSGSHREFRIGANRAFDDSVLLTMFAGNDEAIGWSQLITRIERRRMTARTTFAGKDLTPPLCA